MELLKIIEKAKQLNINEDDIIDEIWDTDLLVEKKVSLSLQLFDQQATYHVLASMWLNYFVSSQIHDEYNIIIFEKYQSMLSNSKMDLENSMEYSLFFDIFQEDREEINIKAWSYFLNNSPTEKFLRIMLLNAAPIPFHIKNKLYQSLIPDKLFHIDIYKSIRNSITYLIFYQAEFNKSLALEIIQKLDIQNKIPEIDAEKGQWKYDEVMNFLKEQ